MQRSRRERLDFRIVIIPPTPRKKPIRNPDFKIPKWEYAIDTVPAAMLMVKQARSLISPFGSEQLEGQMAVQRIGAIDHLRPCHWQGKYRISVCHEAFK